MWLFYLSKYTIEENILLNLFCLISQAIYIMVYSNIDLIFRFYNGQRKFIFFWGEGNCLKKNNILIFVLVILFIVSALSIGLNIRSASEKDRLRKNMINRAYSELTSISYNLNGLILNTESGIINYETNRQSLVMLSSYFTKLDSTLTWYATCFPPKGIARNIYPGAPFNFDFISYTLTDGTGTANDIQYSGITADGTISDNEIRYLTILRDDIDLIVASMVSAENPPQENQNLTASQVDMILDTFFSKWSFHNEDSPYFLLRSE